MLHACIHTYNHYTCIHTIITLNDTCLNAYAINMYAAIPPDHAVPPPHTHTDMTDYVPPSLTHRATHDSLLITHHTLLITHYSLRITHHTLLITHY